MNSLNRGVIDLNKDKNKDKGGGDRKRLDEQARLEEIARRARAGRPRRDAGMGAFQPPAATGILSGKLGA